MSQYKQQGDLEVLNSILQAAEFGKPRDVTGNPDNKYVTKFLVQNVSGPTLESEQQRTAAEGLCPSAMAVKSV